MGNYYTRVVNLDKEERLDIESLGEYHKWCYRYGGNGNGLVPYVVTYLTVWPNCYGPALCKGLQGSWAAQKVLFLGDDEGHSENPNTPWAVKGLYLRSYEFKDITKITLTELLSSEYDFIKKVIQFLNQPEERCLQKFKKILLDIITDPKSSELLFDFKESLKMSDDEIFNFLSHE